MQSGVNGARVSEKGIRRAPSRCFLKCNHLPRSTRPAKGQQSLALSFEGSNTNIEEVASSMAENRFSLIGDKEKK